MEIFDDLISPLPSIEQISQFVQDAPRQSSEMIGSIIGGLFGYNMCSTGTRQARMSNSNLLDAMQCGPSTWTRIAGLSGGLAVAMAAYGAHFILANPDIADERKRAMDHANKHHFLNTFGMALGSVVARYPTITSSLFLLGTVLFCVPSYQFAIRGDLRLRAFTPFGGMLAMLAWFSFIL